KCSNARLKITYPRKTHTRIKNLTKSETIRILTQYMLSHQTPCITSMSSEPQTLGNTSSAKKQWLSMQKREKIWCENVRKPMSNYWWDIVCILNQKPSRSYKCAETEISVKYIFFKDNVASVSEIRTNGD